MRDKTGVLLDGRRNKMDRDYIKGDKVKVINKEPYENTHGGFGLQEYGEIYQVMQDTVIVLFGSVGINMSRNDIELVK